MYSSIRKRAHYDIRKMNSSLSKKNTNVQNTSYKQFNPIDILKNTNNVQIIDVLKNKKTPFVDHKINILLRVSYCPYYFSIWIKSVLEQKYKNFNIICCYDDINSKEYLEKVQDERFSYFYIENDSKEHYTYLLERVQDGWIIFLDDEEHFTDDLSLAKINNLLNHTNDINKILFWKVKNQENIIDIPFNDGEPQDEIIYSSSQYCFHSKYKFLVQNDIANKEETILSKLLNSLTFKLYGFNEILVKTCTEKIGVIITTNGYNGLFVKQCIECYLRTLPLNTYIILYINESKDVITLNLKNDFPSLEIIYIEDQNKEGGLTNTWNKGIDKCFDNNCDIIILSNDDILFDNSILHICNESKSLKDTDMIYFGPMSNNPGNGSNKMQLGLPKNTNSIICKHNNKLWNINGFFMVMTKSVLKANMFNNEYYFNPKYPFGGNETEWFNRFKKIGGKGKIVPRTFIYHYKLKRWKYNNKINNTCIYTINLGGYEGSNIYLNPTLGYDCLYFTDNFKVVYECIKKGIIPFYIDTKNKESKLIQRTIKTRTHLYIPYTYETSIYIDGNVYFKNNIFTKNILAKLINSSYDIICFAHPNRNNIIDEAIVVEKLQLEKKENIEKILDILSKSNFKDNIGLTETNVLLRRHKQIIKFNNEWCECIKLCRRDQLSFDFLLYKNNINYKRFMFHKKMEITNKYEHVNPVNRIL